MIIFPEPNEKSDRVTIKGSKKDVEQCYKYLAHHNKELLSNNFRAEVPIFKQFHKFIIGKGGANIKKVIISKYIHYLLLISILSMISSTNCKKVLFIQTNDKYFMKCHKSFDKFYYK